MMYEISMCYRKLHLVIQTKCDTMESAGDSTDTDSHTRMDELTEKMKVLPFVYFSTLFWTILETSGAWVLVIHT